MADEVFNISSRRYETLKEIGEKIEKIEKIYRVRVVYEDPVGGMRREDKGSFLELLVDFLQWVGSEKIRKQTGWVDRKALFSDGFEVYRRTHEQAVRDGDESMMKMMESLKLRF